MSEVFSSRYVDDFGKKRCDFTCLKRVTEVGYAAAAPITVFQLTCTPINAGGRIRCGDFVVRDEQGICFEKPQRKKI